MRQTAFLIVFLLSVQLFGQTAEQSILKMIDRQISFPENDFSGEYTITIDKPGQGISVTKAILFRRDRADKYLIHILEPPVDKGKGYLKIGNNLWLYDPVGRRFDVTSARDRFQNSNARNSDFTRSTLSEDYIVVSQTSQKLGVYDTTVYDLEAVTDNVTFPKMKIWVDEDNLVRKFEDYSLSGQLMRTTAIPTYQRLGERYVPVSIVIVDALQGRVVDGKFKGERTVITVEKPSLADLPDLYFTQAYLEKMSQ